MFDPSLSDPFIALLQAGTGPPISTLRIGGLIWGTVMLLLVGWRLRSGPVSKMAVLLGAGAGFGLILVSALPGLVTLALTPFLPLEESGFPRLVGLLAVAVLLLIPYQFVLAGNTAANRRDIVALVRALALERYRAQLTSSSTPEVLVVIPAYNEELTLREVLADIPDSVCGLTVEALVVVDGATDRTETISREFGIPAVHTINRGGGAAVVTGLEIAMDRGAQIAVIMDADGQHRPDQLARLLEPIQNDEADMVNGSRLLGGYEREAWIRGVGVKVFSCLVSLLTRQRVTDVSNGYRAFRVSALKGMPLSQEHYYTAEHLIVAISRKLRYVEAPIDIDKRQGGFSKKGGSLIYALGFARSIVRAWLRG